MTSRKHKYVPVETAEIDADEERPFRPAATSGGADASLATQLRRTVWPLVVRYWGPRAPTAREAWGCTLATLGLGLAQCAFLFRLGSSRGALDVPRPSGTLARVVLPSRAPSRGRRRKSTPPQEDVAAVDRCKSYHDLRLAERRRRFASSRTPRRRRGGGATLRESGLRRSTKRKKRSSGTRRPRSRRATGRASARASARSSVWLSSSPRSAPASTTSGGAYG